MLCKWSCVYCSKLSVAASFIIMGIWDVSADVGMNEPLERLSTHWPDIRWESTVINDLRRGGGARCQTALSHAQPLSAAASTIRTPKPLTLLERYRRLCAPLGQINTDSESESWGWQYTNTVRDGKTVERNSDGCRFTKQCRMLTSVLVFLYMNLCHACSYMQRASDKLNDKQESKSEDT